MVSSPFKWPLSAIGGVLVTVIFYAFTLASIALYPVPFSPMDNWLSDLGNANLNPSGDIFFNAGCILTGLAMLVLMAGLGQWHVDGWKRLTLMAGQACGVLSALALMSIGIFTEGTPMHGTLAITFFALLFLFLVLTNVSIFSRPQYIKWIGYYALLVVAIDLVFIYTFFAYAYNTIWEWLAVFSALLWVAMLAFNMFKLDQQTSSPKKVQDHTA